MAASESEGGEDTERGSKRKRVVAKGNMDVMIMLVMSFVVISVDNQGRHETSGHACSLTEPASLWR